MKNLPYASMKSLGAEITLLADNPADPDLPRRALGIGPPQGDLHGNDSLGSGADFVDRHTWSCAWQSVRQRRYGRPFLGVGHGAERTASQGRQSLRGGRGNSQPDPSQLGFGCFHNAMRRDRNRLRLDGPADGRRRPAMDAAHQHALWPHAQARSAMGADRPHQPGWRRNRAAGGRWRPVAQRAIPLSRAKPMGACAGVRLWAQDSNGQSRQRLRHRICRPPVHPDRKPRFWPRPFRLQHRWHHGWRTRRPRRRGAIRAGAHTHRHAEAFGHLGELWRPAARDLRQIRRRIDRCRLRCAPSLGGGCGVFADVHCRFAAAAVPLWRYRRHAAGFMPLPKGSSLSHLFGR